MYPFQLIHSDHLGDGRIAAALAAPAEAPLCRPDAAAERRVIAQDVHLLQPAPHLLLLRPVQHESGRRRRKGAEGQEKEHGQPAAEHPRQWTVVAVVPVVA